MPKQKQLIDETFLDKAGSKIQIKKVVDKDDCWQLPRENKWVLTHRAIKRIAKLAGISSNYEVVESEVKPTYKNEMEHIVRVTIHCTAKKTKNATSCVHSDETELTVTGESNMYNTPNRGRGYLRKMAEKRAFDIAVLEHLDLYSAIFSEEEAETFSKKDKVKESDLMPGEKEFESIVDEINAILNSKDKTELKKAAQIIKAGIKLSKYTDRQKKYLKELWISESGKKTIKF